MRRSCPPAPLSYPDLLTGDLYVLGTAVTLTTLQFAQVLGFAVGGAVVGFFGVRVSLVIDAATFALSALITFVWVRSWPAVQAIADREAGAEADGGLLAGLRLVFTSPALRIPMLLGWLAAFYNIPEGVSAPLAGALGGGAVAVGFILAAPALGATVGAIAFGRFVAPATRVRWMIPLAAAACGVLVLFVFRPPLPIALALLAVSAVIFDCYQLAANASFVAATPARQRSQAFGIAQGGMSLGQGVAMIVAGAAAGHYRPETRDSDQRCGRRGRCYRYRPQPERAHWATGALIRLSAPAGANRVSPSCSAHRGCSFLR